LVMTLVAHMCLVMLFVLAESWNNGF
jgi:hypothetical protein